MFYLNELGEEKIVYELEVNADKRDERRQWAVKLWEPIEEYMNTKKNLGIKCSGFFSSTIGKTISYSSSVSAIVGYDFEAFSIWHVYLLFSISKFVDSGYKLDSIKWFSQFYHSLGKQSNEDPAGLSEMEALLNGKKLADIFNSIYNGFDIYKGSSRERRYMDIISYSIENFGFVSTECKSSLDPTSQYYENIIADIFSYIFLGLDRAIATEKLIIEPQYQQVHITYHKSNENFEILMGKFVKTRKLLDFHPLKFYYERFKKSTLSKAPEFLEVYSNWAKHINRIVNEEKSNLIRDNIITDLNSRENLYKAVKYLYKKGKFEDYRSFKADEFEKLKKDKNFEKTAVRSYDGTWRLAINCWTNIYSFVPLKDEELNKNLEAIKNKVNFFILYPHSGTDVVIYEGENKKDLNIDLFKDHSLVTVYRKKPSGKDYILENGIMLINKPQIDLNKLNDIWLGHVRGKGNNREIEDAVFLTYAYKDDQKNEVYLLKGHVCLNDKGEFEYLNDEQLTCFISRQKENIEKNDLIMNSEGGYRVNLPSSMFIQVGNKISCVMQKIVPDFIFTPVLFKPFTGTNVLTPKTFRPDPTDKLISQEDFDKKYKSNNIFASFIDKAGYFAIYYLII
ncbi:MAG: hypothetical protein ACTSUN_00560 [Promethearchaeota archaeon]